MNKKLVARIIMSIMGVLIIFMIESVTFYIGYSCSDHNKIISGIEAALAIPGLCVVVTLFAWLDDIADWNNKSKQQ